MFKRPGMLDVSVTLVYMISRRDDCWICIHLGVLSKILLVIIPR
jgi:hypothetical protein